MFLISLDQKPVIKFLWPHHCYDNFRKISPNDSEQIILLSNEAMQKVVDEMYCDRRLCTCTWTSTDLHEKHTSYDGKLT